MSLGLLGASLLMLGAPEWHLTTQGGAVLQTGPTVLVGGAGGGVGVRVRPWEVWQFNLSVDIYGVVLPRTTAITVGASRVWKVSPHWHPVFGARMIGYTGGVTRLLRPGERTSHHLPLSLEGTLTPLIIDFEWGDLEILELGLGLGLDVWPTWSLSATPLRIVVAL